MGMLGFGPPVAVEKFAKVKKNFLRRNEIKTFSDEHEYLEDEKSDESANLHVHER